MRYPDQLPHRFAICFHPEAQTAAHSLAEDVKSTLIELEANCVFCGSIYADELQKLVETSELDILVALGGDGTMLRAGHLCAPHEIPILGINNGKFGFLTEVKDGHWRESLSKLISGDYQIEDRFMIRVEHWSASSLLNSWDALNEVVVSRGSQVRPIRMSASVNGYALADFVADALIVSTPTGSTAYALAAGGPIIAPEMNTMLIIPVAPHLSVDRGVVVPCDAHIQVNARTTHEAVLSVDGQEPILVRNEDHILAYASKNMVSFIRFQDPGYFYRNLTKYMEQNPSAGDT